MIGISCWRAGYVRTEDESGYPRLPLHRGRQARAREMSSTIDEALRTLALVMGFLCSQFPAEGGVPTSIISAASGIRCEQNVNTRIRSMEAELLLAPAMRSLILNGGQMQGFRAPVEASSIRP